MLWKQDETQTHVGATDVIVDAAQNLWAICSDWYVKYHLINQ